ncbi:major facilitator superfamily domain-containing protein [Triangularia verruculosa]|uniref:Major facilitator superfamily domain-containing protein n=1 Tax=Triangularia verruculosa TaxID=2587418 RepID=A0AAN6XKA0_9PEZI|nr:major facilitator superfamily domain-containing protein [Triangularia verruculosa]
MSRTATTTRTAHPSPHLETDAEHLHAAARASRTSFQIDDPRAVGDDEAPGLSKAVILKLLSAAFSFFVSGVNDGSIGALIPHIIRSYGITTAIVSALYASSFLGWLAAAFSNTHLSQRLDLGAMMVLGAAFQVAAHALRAWPTPPFGLFISTFLLASIGQAYQDTQANTFVASEKGLAVHRWLGFIHAMYMAGCLVAPFAASPIASSPSKEGSSQWYFFYTLPLGLGVANLALAMVAFRDSFRFRPRASKSGVGPAEKSAFSLIKETLTTRSVWLLSLFFFFYLGVSVTAGGWVVEYLVDVRNGNLTQMGYVPAGFSGGCLLGRLLLPDPTHKWGERRMIFLYCLFCLGFQLLFWLVPNIIAASVAISFLGFFLGPFFATAISVGTRIFPPDIRPTALSFLFVFAQLGGSLFPIITGVMGARLGVSVMQPVLVALISATGIVWLFVPQSQAKQE